MKLSMTEKKIPVSLTSISQILPKDKVCVNENDQCCKIKENFGNEIFFSETVFKKDVLNLIKKLPGNKANVSKDIK